MSAPSTQICSALGRKLAVLPFNRDVQLTEMQARTIAACVAHMRQVRAHAGGQGP
jgi:hypothetical protein